MKSVSYLARVFATLVCGVTLSAHAADNTGACDQYDLSDWLSDPEGKRVTAINSGASVFKRATGRAEARDPLRFMERMTLFDADRGRAKVVDKNDQEGWVELKDLLCGSVPLTNEETGLTRKAFIRTGRRDVTNVADRTATVFRYPSADLSGCREEPGFANSCRQLSRFTLTYVFEETENAVLLGSEYNHRHTRPRLFGWVAKDNVLMWDHAGGLRGDEGLTYEDGVGTVCGYPTMKLARAGNKAACQPILGGNSWFKSPWRLPILSEPQGGFYRVAAATTGFAGGKSRDGNVVLVNPEGEAAPKLDFANNLDVFFVMDGTRSMTPQIDRIRGTGTSDGIVRRLKNRLQDKAEQGTLYRFGFRVYTDTANGDVGVADFRALDNNSCSEASEAAIARANQEFETAVRKIQTISDVNDDYAENTWGGLEQAIRDAGGCRDNIKLMFMIGDAGYDPSMQAARGYTPVELDRLARSIERRNMAIFFIRPPLNPNNTNPAYIESWNQFRTQGLELLSRLDKQNHDPSAYFFDLGEQDSARTDDIIIDRVDELSRPELITELKLDLSGGAALSKAVERLQAGGNDVPVLLWNMIGQGACKKGPRQCDTRVIQNVAELYVPVSDEVQEDVWLLDRDLAAWNAIVNSLDPDVPGQEKRRSVVNTLITSLENTLNVNYDEMAIAGETFGQFVQRVQGLPVNLQSPLMQYSPDELMDPTEVPSCEIDSLIDWTKKAGEMLNIVRGGYNRPEYAAISVPACDRMSSKGAGIPYVPEVLSTPLGPNKQFNFSSKIGGERRYWVPEEYMP